MLLILPLILPPLVGPAQGSACPSQHVAQETIPRDSSKERQTATISISSPADLLAAFGTLAAGRSLRPASPTAACRAERGRRTRLVPRVCGRLPHPREKGRAVTGLSPVDRRKTGSKHYVICDGRGTPLHFITTAANVNDITQALILVDGIPPVAGRPGRPRRRPDAVLGDKAYDSKAVRRELRRRRILPVISRKGASNIKGVGKLRYVVEQTFALLHQFKALPSDGSDGSNFTTP
ncbi:transposase [Streptomyces olivaceus]|uniref:transposase n=1 Tax=Streptomyces olivaceus TaxID=47716 RepID=UPI0033E617B9